MTTPPSPKRTVPQSELDFNMMVTETLWGSPFVSDDLKETLTKQHQYVDEDGNPVVNNEGQILVRKEALWGLMSYYTRDLRLANLSSTLGEMGYCRYYLDLAGDYLKMNYLKAFLICISRVATVLELSQSKGGFLRKQMNTLTTEQRRNFIEPEKKTLLKQKGGGD